MSEDKDMHQHFDLEVWKKQGENRALFIDDQIIELQNQKEQISDRIDELSSEKTIILKALGKWEEPKNKPGNGDGRKGKVMIKPVLLAKFVESTGEELTEEELIDAVQEEKPTANADSIRTSLHRLTQTYDNITKSDEGKYTYVESSA